VLQDCVSERDGHTLPPWSAFVVMERERLCEPPPQLRVQVDHAEKADVTQWIGHGPSLHACVSESTSQATPPYADAVVVMRPRECVPAPHECEQLPHESHADCTQSMGQTAVLQSCVSDTAGQATPPWAAMTSTARVRSCEPEPHVSEHCCHEPHSPTTQSTGHAVMLQAMVSLIGPHGVPPYMLVTSVLRERD
jgi:hypothetical protein